MSINTAPARVDANQAEIVKTLRAAGASVQHLHTVGHGCPDLLVGYHGQNFLMEVKRPGARLTEDEQEWHIRWPVAVYTVHSQEEALQAIGAALYSII